MECDFGGMSLLEEALGAAALGDLTTRMYKHLFGCVICI